MSGLSPARLARYRQACQGMPIEDVHFARLVQVAALRNARARLARSRLSGVASRWAEEELESSAAAIERSLPRGVLERARVGGGA